MSRTRNGADLETAVFSHSPGERTRKSVKMGDDGSFLDLTKDLVQSFCLPSPEFLRVAPKGIASAHEQLRLLSASKPLLDSGYEAPGQKG